MGKLTISTTDKAYDYFLEIFLRTHNLKLPLKNITNESKTLRYL